MPKRLASLLVLAAACGRPAEPPSPPAPPRMAPPVQPHIEVRTPEDAALLRVARLEAVPAAIDVAVDGKAPLRVTAYDAHGHPVPGAQLRISGAEDIVRLLPDGSVLGVRPGTDTLVVQAPAPSGTDLSALEIRIPVTVHPPRDHHAEAPHDAGLAAAPRDARRPTTVHHHVAADAAPTQDARRTDPHRLRKLQLRKGAILAWYTGPDPRAAGTASTRTTDAAAAGVSTE
ncbi:MAG TPA: hypothetical protein VF158_01800 [Longimicrobiales bacterium]